VITQTTREQLGIGGMDKIVAFDQSQNMDDLKACPVRTRSQLMSKSRSKA